jgi:hypothetical protein
MPVDLNELLVEVAGDAATSLLVGVSATDGRAAPGVCGGRGGIYFPATPSMVGVPSFSDGALGIGFPIPRGAIIANHEEFPWEAPVQQWSLGEDAGDGLGDCLGGALGFGT